MEDELVNEDALAAEEAIDNAIDNWEFGDQTADEQEESPANSPELEPTGGEPDGESLEDKEGVKSPEPEPVAAEPEDKPVELRSTQLAALARRERELREREERLKAEEARLTQSSIPKDETRLRDRLDTSKLSTDELFALSTYEKLGDKTPAEWMAVVKDLERDAKYSEYQKSAKEKEHQELALQAEAVFIKREIKSLVHNVPSEYGYLRDLAMDSPEDAQRALTELIASEADRTGSFMSVRDAARLLSESLEEEVSRYLSWSERRKKKQAELKAPTGLTQVREDAPLSEAETMTTPTKDFTEGPLDFDERIDVLGRKWGFND